MNKNEQGQEEEGEWGGERKEEGEEGRGRGTLFKQIPNFETTAGKGELESERESEVGRA